MENYSYKDSGEELAINSSSILLEAHNLKKVFYNGELPLVVIKNLSLVIREGEFLALMGRSGAGKSTLLYQLSLLDKPTEGGILMNGVNSFDFSEEELQEFRLNTLGYVFQDYALIPELNAEENVALPLLMRGFSMVDALEAANLSLNRVGLTERNKKRPSQLSGGEQQRVAIARAIAGNPKILFADEPTANLDTTSGRLVIETLKKLNDQGMTVVMVTHEEDYARLCKRMVVMEDGQIIKDISLEKTGLSDLV